MQELDIIETEITNALDKKKKKKKKKGIKQPAKDKINCEQVQDKVINCHRPQRPLHHKGNMYKGEDVKVIEVNDNKVPIKRPGDHKSILLWQLSHSLLKIE